jgi:hypothetical protein
MEEEERKQKIEKAIQRELEGYHNCLSGRVDDCVFDVVERLYPSLKRREDDWCEETEWKDILQDIRIIILDYLKENKN